MGSMREKDDSILGDILGTILVIAIVGATICGILECFNINTGIIGGILCIIPILYLIVIAVVLIIKWLNK